MLGTAAKLVSGIGTIATRGAGMNAARKFGMGTAFLGYGVQKAANSDFMSQYMISRYGEEKGGQRLNSIKSIGSIAGVGMMGFGAVGVYRGKSSALGLAKAPFKAGIAVGRGISSLATGARLKVQEAGAMKSASAGLNRMASGVGRFAKKHPYLGVALPVGIMGGAVAGGFSAHNRSVKRRGAMEGTITSVRGFQHGSMAPSMQFANTPGMSQRMGRRGGNRIMR